VVVVLEQLVVLVPDQPLVGVEQVFSLPSLDLMFKERAAVGDRSMLQEPREQQVPAEVA
jgi:hypothetical protein